MASFHQVHYRWAQEIAERHAPGDYAIRVLHDERGFYGPRSVSLWLRDRSSGRSASIPLAGFGDDLSDDPAREEHLRQLLSAAFATSLGPQ